MFNLNCIWPSQKFTALFCFWSTFHKVSAHRSGCWHALNQVVIHVLTHRKDTKNSNTWWCFTAPINPTRAMRKRKMPTAIATPTTLKLEMRPKPIPHAAIPISSKLTSWREEKTELVCMLKEAQPTHSYIPYVKVVTRNVQFFPVQREAAQC